jgi:dihydrofolate synthase/folylpolyglutamate synthase
VGGSIVPASVDALAGRLADTAAGRGDRHPDVETALSAALARAHPGDRILVFGSFHTATAALQSLATRDS